MNRRAFMTAFLGFAAVGMTQRAHAALTAPTIGKALVTDGFTGRSIPALEEALAKFSTEDVRRHVFSIIDDMANAYDKKANEGLSAEDARVCRATNGKGFNEFSQKGLKNFANFLRQLKQEPLLASNPNESRTNLIYTLWTLRAVSPGKLADNTTNQYALLPDGIMTTLHKDTELHKMGWIATFMSQDRPEGPQMGEILLAKGNTNVRHPRLNPKGQSDTFNILFRFVSATRHFAHRLEKGRLPVGGVAFAKHPSTGVYSFYNNDAAPERRPPMIGCTPR